MHLNEIRGASRLVELVDDAVCAADPDLITERVKNSLCRLIRGAELSMPEFVCQPVSGHYARRLLYRSERHGYSMVAMTWGPGQGTPLHDHAGMWCVEAVCQGAIRVVQYEPLEQQADRYRFGREESVHASVGTAGCLIPPHEYHTIHNASDTDPAVTLHIYGGEMACCNAFEPLGDGWYRKVQKDLSYDTALEQTA
jgi:3-mercaptopropionate dioxygenase